MQKINTQEPVEEWKSGSRHSVEEDSAVTKQSLPVRKKKRIRSAAYWGAVHRGLQAMRHSIRTAPKRQVRQIHFIQSGVMHVFGVASLFWVMRTWPQLYNQPVLLVGAASISVLLAYFSALVVSPVIDRWLTTWFARRQDKAQH